MKHLILTGFMAAGKTTIGSLLGPELKLEFVDCDDEVFKETGLQVPAYIRRFGVKPFRKIEKSVLKRVLKGSPVVLATGGGAMLDRENRRLILSQGFCVWLDTPLSLILKRFGNKNRRPLLPKPFSVEKLNSFFQARKSFYRHCHLRVVNTFDSPQKIAMQIIKEYASRTAE